MAPPAAATTLTRCQPTPDFFQIINYATNEAVGVNDPNRIQNTFKIGAALIDLYDGDDLTEHLAEHETERGAGDHVGGVVHAHVDAAARDEPGEREPRRPVAPVGGEQRRGGERRRRVADGTSW